MTIKNSTDSKENKSDFGMASEDQVKRGFFSVYSNFPEIIKISRVLCHSK
jgi:hypothetical protein